MIGYYWSGFFSGLAVGAAFVGVLATYMLFGGKR